MFLLKDNTLYDAQENNTHSQNTDKIKSLTIPLEEYKTVK